MLDLKDVNSPIIMTLISTGTFIAGIFCLYKWVNGNKKVTTPSITPYPRTHWRPPR